ncbi:hypothetical protein A5689_27100 [Mycobacterium intracellulare subsp. yongonense]|nr:hypothetical protein A5689_27100 [Mycobacterium intracellulare subsp. yongonense]
MGCQFEVLSTKPSGLDTLGFGSCVVVGCFATQARVVSAQFGELGGRLVDRAVRGGDTRRIRSDAGLCELVDIGAL